MNRLSWIALGCLAVAVAFCAVSTQSLWIDEANSAVKAIAPDWTGFKAAMVSGGGSDMQMPLYMASLWGWEKFFGHSEYALRAMNIPLLLLAFATVIWLSDFPVAERVGWLILATLSPLVWSYLDEARPYILQFMSASVFMVAMGNLALRTRESPRSRDLGLAMAACLLLCASSLTGVIYAFFFGMAFLILWHSRENILATFKRPICVLFLPCCVGLAALGFYYICTLKSGARATGGQTNLTTIAFSFYEFVGAAGLGPGRVELRQNGPSAIKPFLPILAFFLAASLIFLFAGFASLRKGVLRNWRLLLIFFAPLAGSAAIILVGLKTEFRVVARHLMPLLPFVICAASFLMVSLWYSRSIFRRAVVIIYLSLLALSCLSIRFSSRFAKDEYREVAKVAKEALVRKEMVWWAADKAASIYYNVVPNWSGTNANVCLVANISHPETLPLPKVVILSKVDIYDGSGALREWLVGNGFQVSKRFPAMTVWSKESTNKEESGGRGGK